jgi:hypothetical protein
MIGIRDEYAPKFGRQTLTLWEGGFMSSFVGWAHELPKHNGFMVTLANGQKIRVDCPAPRNDANFQQVDESIRSAVGGQD